MKACDTSKFEEVMIGVCDYYGKPRLSSIVLSIYFTALERFEFPQISKAISQHLANPKNGQFIPKVADIISHIEGGEITTDKIIAAARLKDTPLGILCRIQIGSYDLNNADPFYLRQRAEECIQKLPEWKARASIGDYTDHEISMMLKHEVNPCSQFITALPQSNSQLKERVLAITHTPKHKFLLSEPYSEETDKKAAVHPDIKNRLALALNNN